MKRIIMLASAGVVLTASVAFALIRRRRQQMHAADLADADVIIDEVIVHFEPEEPLFRY
jgi:hypothetical protein